MDFKYIQNYLYENKITCNIKTLYRYLYSNFCSLTKIEIDNLLYSFYNSANDFIREQIIALTILDVDELRKELGKTIDNDFIEWRKIRLATIFYCIKGINKDTNFVYDFVKLSDTLDLFYEDSDMPQFIITIPNTEHEFYNIIRSVNDWIDKEKQLLRVNT